MDILKLNSSIHIEALIEDISNKESLKEPILNYLKSLKDSVLFDEVIEIRGVKHLEDCKSLWIEKNIYKSEEKQKFLDIKDNENVIFHFFRANDDNADDDGSLELEFLEDQNAGASEVAQTSVKHYLLPAQSLVGLWHCLKMDNDVKESLLRFSLCSLMLKKYHLDANKISCNNLIVLYGPPGTGKTSLCKALAQKIAIRQSDNYRYTHLIEINSHNLLSKWFSESGKLIGRLFSHIRELASDVKNLVIVLIDEVESIAYDRKSLNGEEPKDAMRVVNSFLTELDTMKKYSNILVLATSNLENTIDSAFLDRADMMIKIDLPSYEARKAILKGIFQEIFDKGILEISYNKNSVDDISAALASMSNGLSGRYFSKIPYLVFSELSGETALKEDMFYKKFEAVLMKETVKR